MQNTEIQILTKIKKARRGALFFADSFVNFGSAKTDEFTKKLCALCVSSVPLCATFVRFIFCYTEIHGESTECTERI